MYTKFVDVYTRYICRCAFAYMLKHCVSIFNIKFCIISPKLVLVIFLLPVIFIQTNILCLLIPLCRGWWEKKEVEREGGREGKGQGEREKVRKDPSGHLLMVPSSNSHV